MATLYTHIDQNIAKTWALMGAFLALVIAIGFLFAQAMGEPAILYIAVGFSLFMNFLSYWFADKLVLSLSRAREIKREDHEELFRIVENLVIAAGLPMPKLYIIESAASNAFATGRNPEHAAVAVTRGLLERLNRQELEGVLSHELAHIGNRDMLVATIAVILAGFIAILADFFLRISFYGGGRRESREGGNALMALAIVAAILAPIAATLLRLAISRKREFLADASGALLTRNPEALASALVKISTDSDPLETARVQTAHLFIDDPFKNRHGKTRWFIKLFMTHPPIEERIRALRGMEV
ncbi:M48 family metallopeptidase [Candidatus Parcubacteria bacterium]|nr:M48 family metallopeptidase [Candidatus Parcubacteria bacterium]